MPLTIMSPVANLGNKESGTFTPVVFPIVPEHLSSPSMAEQGTPVSAAEF